MPTSPKLALRWSRDDAPAPDEEYSRYNLFLGEGSHPVGWLLLWNWPQRGDMRWRFSWTCHLPGLDLAPGGTEAAENRTFEQARLGLVAEVENWFVRAGLVESVDPAVPAATVSAAAAVSPDPQVETVQIDLNVILALAIFHAERGDTSMIERLRAERVEEQIQSVISTTATVAVGSPRFAAAAREYACWSTGFDSSRPPGARSWVCRISDYGSCIETSSHPESDEADRACHEQALAAAISAALAHVEEADRGDKS